MRQMIYRSMCTRHFADGAGCNAGSTATTANWHSSRWSPLAMSSPRSGASSIGSIDSQFAPGRSPATSPSIVRCRSGRSKVLRPGGHTGLDVRGRGGSSLGSSIAADLSRLPRGCMFIAATPPVTTEPGRAPGSRHTAGYRRVPCPSFECWQQGRPAPFGCATSILTRRTCRPGSPFPAGRDKRSESPRRLHGGLPVDIRAITRRLRRASLVYDAHGLFRSFVVVRRSRPGEQGGEWLASDGDARTWSTRSTPRCSGPGSNVVTLCRRRPRPETSRSRSCDHRELDTGLDKATGVTLRRAPARRSGRCSTATPQQRWRWRAASGSRSRRPPDSPGRPRAVRNRRRAPAPTGGRSRRHATSGAGTASYDGDRQLLVIDGGDLRLPAIGARFDRRATLAELDVVGLGAAEPVTGRARHHQRRRSTSGPRRGSAASSPGPAAMTGAIRVEVAGQTSAAMTATRPWRSRARSPRASPWPSRRSSPRWSGLRPRPDRAGHRRGLATKPPTHAVARSAPAAGDNDRGQSTGSARPSRPRRARRASRARRTSRRSRRRRGPTVDHEQLAGRRRT